MMIPFLLKPPVKDYIWGGTRLREEFGKKSSLDRLAESWELSCHPDGESIIASGEFNGLTLTEFITKHPEALGRKCEKFRFFPVLIKLIDAKNDLSIQVHPDDEYALRTEGEYGKTEMWYIVDCEPGAELIYGFKEKITRDQFRKAVEENFLLEYVNRVPVKKGDVFFIRSGTLHAIGKGILIAEIQQNSNTTYRVYDYGRLGKDGKPRELHIEKALEVTNLEPSEKYTLPPPSRIDSDITEQELAECEYFRVMKFDLYDENGEFHLKDTEICFQHILVIDGEAQLYCGGKELPLKKGSSVFVPAGADACYIKGRCSIILTTI